MRLGSLSAHQSRMVFPALPHAPGLGFHVFFVHEQVCAFEDGDEDIEERGWRSCCSSVSWMDLPPALRIRRSALSRTSFMNLVYSSLRQR